MDELHRGWIPRGEQAIESRKVDTYKVKAVTGQFLQSTMFELLHNSELWYQAV